MPTEIATGIVDGLSGNECYLLIFATLFISYLIITANNKHNREMEIIRLKQYKSLFQKEEGV